nr:lipase family protein [Microbacterium ulmi]
MPRLASRVPPWWLLAGGAVILLLGLLLVTRPLTSLALLAGYVGASAIASGVLDLTRPHAHRWWGSLSAVLWILGGLAVLLWLGRGLDSVANVIALLLVVGGLVSFADALRGRISERVLAVVWGAAQLAFGVFALSWPDVTTLVTALVFGVRTVAFGVALVVRALRDLGSADRATPPPPAAARRAVLWADAGRWALSVVLVGAVAAGWSLNDWFEEGAPVVDGFYSAPDPLPRAPGVLLREDGFAGREPAGGDVRRILYTTRDAAGRIVPASGFVIFPEGQETRTLRPAVVWAHGTTGVARGCAPSLTDSAATKWAIPGVDDALARGWVVVAPDFPGQGADGVFPYLIGRGEAHAALDAVRAARAVQGVDLDGKVAVWGHSQGGHAAMWTSTIADDYAPELRIVGTAALAPAADPLALARVLTAGGGSPELSVLISWVLVPYSETYPDVELPDYVTAGGRQIVREMTMRCPTEPGILVSVLAALGVSEDRPLYRGDLTGGALGRRLAQNAADGPLGSPVFLAWGRDDEVIPPGLQRRLFSQLCDAGEQVRRLEYRGIHHQDLLQPRAPMAPMLVAWTQARFDGARPVDDCRAEAG